MKKIVFEIEEQLKKDFEAKLLEESVDRKQRISKKQKIIELIKLFVEKK